MHGSATIDIIDPSGDAQDPQPRRRWTRWLRFLLVVLALGGFGAFVAYVYYGMIRDAAIPDGQIPLVRADPAPFRSRPENPGGVAIPHQNFEVYDRLGQPSAPQAGPGGRQVERLLPPPEAPLPRPPAAPPAPAASAPPAPPAVPAAPPAPSPSPAAPPAAEAGSPAPSSPPAAAQPAVPAPARAAPAQATTTPLQAGGAPVRIQVGALPTQELAAREAERLRRRYGEIFGRIGITVVRGESGGNAIYRVQAGPVRDRAAADELCSALRQHRVGCIIVAR